MQADQLSGYGVDKVVAVTVNTPEAVQQLASKLLPKGSKVGPNWGPKQKAGKRLVSAESAALGQGCVSS